MLKLLRLLVLLGTPVVFWGAWYVAPELLGADGLRWLSGLVAFLWGMEFHFFRRLSDVSSVEGLSSREHELLVYRLASIRKRVWWIGGIALLCTVVIWLMVQLGLPASSPLYATLVGVLFGINLSYLILIPGWLNESQGFIDRVRQQDKLDKRRVEAAKGLKPVDDKKGK